MCRPGYLVCNLSNEEVSAMRRYLTRPWVRSFAVQQLISQTSEVICPPHESSLGKSNNAVRNYVGKKIQMRFLPSLVQSEGMLITGDRSTESKVPLAGFPSPLFSRDNIKSRIGRTAPHDPQDLAEPSDAAPHLGQLLPCMVDVFLREGGVTSLSLCIFSKPYFSRVFESRSGWAKEDSRVKEEKRRRRKRTERGYYSWGKGGI